jgi:hypothetical protein
LGVRHGGGSGLPTGEVGGGGVAADGSVGHRFAFELRSSYRIQTPSASIDP